MINLRLIVKNFFRDIVRQEVTTLMKLHDEKCLELSNKVQERLNKVPVFFCWYCTEGIIEGASRIGYLGMAFHAGTCFDQYLRIIKKPDSDYKYANGHPIHNFDGKK